MMQDPRIAVMQAIVQRQQSAYERATDRNGLNQVDNIYHSPTLGEELEVVAADLQSVDTSLGAVLEHARQSDCLHVITTYPAGYEPDDTAVAAPEFSDPRVRDIGRILDRHRWFYNKGVKFVLDRVYKNPTFGQENTRMTNALLHIDGHLAQLREIAAEHGYDDIAELLR